jgi:Reverse transcriptase (RNA-dependent DNA polymerase)
MAKIIDSDNNLYCAIVHEALFDDSPQQTEALISTSQVRKFNDNAIDDCDTDSVDTRGNPGTQCSVISGHKMPFFFDGAKCFYKVQSITSDEIKTLPHVVFTDGSLPYDPIHRASTRRLTTIQHDWKRCLGYPNDMVIKKTLGATTQLIPTVEAETRELMRDHFKTRIPELKLTRRNDIAYVDTFFSSITSVRGYKCWNLFCFKDSGYDYPVLLQRKSQTPDSLQDFLLYCGAPKMLYSDNAPEFKSKSVLAILRQYMIDRHYTEPHHPNQDLAERRGGMLKAATTHLLLVTGAPLTYWCFALEFVAHARTMLARRSLGWRTPHEKMFHETPDISMFRFPFYCPIWYYTPRATFPHAKMMPARFLGIERRSGDSFCFLIVTEPEDESTSPQFLVRSVIRRRFPHQDAPLYSETTASTNTLTFLRNDERTPLANPHGWEEEYEMPPVSSHPNTEETSSVPVDPVDVYNQRFREVYGYDSPDTTCPAPTSNAEPRSTVDEMLDSTSHLLLDNNVSAELPTDTNSEEMCPPVSTTESTPTHHEQPIITTMSTPLPNYKITTANANINEGIQYIDSITPNDNSIPEVTQDSDDNKDDADMDDLMMSEDKVRLDDVAFHMESMADADHEERLYEGIVGHKYNDGQLQLEVQWKTGETSDIPFTLMRHDHPYDTAVYIRDKRIGTAGGTYNTGTYQRWARTVLRTIRRVVRRIRKQQRHTFMDLPIPHIPDEPIHGVAVIRRAPLKRGNTGHSTKKKTKPGRISRPLEEKFGILIPRNINDARELDRLNGDTGWVDAINKEIGTLLELECFTFLDPDYKPGPEYQFAPLRMIFEVKQDGRKKARLTIGGHVVDSHGISTRSTVVKTISVRLIDLISHRDNLTLKHGDVGNAFITAPCMEKIYSRATPEFGERSESIVILNKALYGLRTSGRAFRNTFADFLRQLGFVPTRYDRDVWMRLRDSMDGYDYICTHVDDFKVAARDPDMWIQQIASVFTLKTAEDPDYYLGLNYNRSTDEPSVWITGCQTYVKECIRRVEATFPEGTTLTPQYTPLPDESHPELDDSEFLSHDGRRQYQGYIGMIQWATTIGRPDVSFAVSSLSRFSAAPRQGHLDLVLHILGYLKRFPHRRIRIDSRPIIWYTPRPDPTFHEDFLEDYPNAKEEIDPNLPTPYGTELETSIFFDADHAHDQKTRRSITGLIILVGRTPILWSSKRQGCIATSTYTAEFVAMRQAVEEAISLRYMLRCLGIPVTKPTDLYGDNRSVYQSAGIPDGELKKKHVAISYHYVREAIAAKVVNSFWVQSAANLADICTKALGRNAFRDIVEVLMCL